MYSSGEESKRNAVPLCFNVCFLKILFSCRRNICYKNLHFVEFYQNLFSEIDLHHIIYIYYVNVNRTWQYLQTHFDIYKFIMSVKFEFK